MCTQQAPLPLLLLPVPVPVPLLLLLRLVLRRQCQRVQREFWVLLLHVCQHRVDQARAEGRQRVPAGVHQRHMGHRRVLDSKHGHTGQAGRAVQLLSAPDVCGQVQDTRSSSSSKEDKDQLLIRGMPVPSASCLSAGKLVSYLTANAATRALDN